MFKLELFSLLKDIKEAEGQKREELLKSLNKLLSQHPQEFHDLEIESPFSEDVKSIITQAQNLGTQDVTPHNSGSLNPEYRDAAGKMPEQRSSSDLEKVRSAYSQWLDEFERTRSDVTPNMAAIIDDMVNFYAPKRFGVLKQVLEIQDSGEYDLFKLHIKNRLRGYYAQKVKEYLSSDKYLNLKFLAKYRKDKELRKLLKNINNYNFEPEHIMEVLK